LVLPAAETLVRAAAERHADTHDVLPCTHSQGSRAAGENPLDVLTHSLIRKMREKFGVGCLGALFC
jgi:hypothetical protein